MTNVQLEKKQLRRQIAQIKKQYTQEEKKQFSQTVWQQVEALKVFDSAQCVLAYWSMPDEVVTHPWVNKWYKNKCILLPVIRGNTLALKIFEGEQKMIPGPFYGISEPAGADFTQYNQIDLALVPGVAFDSEGNRLGRGKAYYDKLLPQFQAYRIGIAFHYQQVARVPVAPTDYPMHTVLFSKPNEV